jgi:PAS domain S-box-containing protein
VSGAASAAVLAPDPIRVLLIEDDEDDYVLTRELLGEMTETPFVLDWQPTVESARAALQRGGHDICLLDYRLGEANGIELLKEAHAVGYDAPVIVLTGQGNHEIDLAAMRAGAAYYLAKAAIDGPSLERTIRYALQLRRAEQRARDSEARMRAILDHALDGIITIDPLGTIETFNTAAERLFGYAAAEAIGRNIRELMAGDDRVAHDEYLRRYRESGARHMVGTMREVIGRRRDGSLVPLELAVNEMVIHGRRTFIGSVRDITERQALNAELEQRVAARTAELAAVNQELEAFSYSVSHDLRAPLRAIDGFAQALADEHGAALPDSGRHFLDRVRAGARHMSQLIDDLLELAHVSRADMRRQEVDLSALAKDIITELRRKDPQRRVEVDIGPALSAQGDPILLRQLLQNLLDNAWKYTGRQPVAHIWFDAEQRDDARVFRVRDDGAGFDPAHAGKLFQPFQRMHGAGEFEGSGVGLATVQRIVHRHGGRVWAESAVGRGTTVFFTL